MSQSRNFSLDRRPVAPLPEPPERSGDKSSVVARIRLLLLVAGVLGVLVFVFLPLITFRASREVIMPPVLSPVNVSTGDELISLLKEKGLWEITGDFAVPRLLLSSYPANIGTLGTEAKKKAFLNSLLPTALLAMGEVEMEKASLHAILARIPGGYRGLSLSASLDLWAGPLSKEEVDVLMGLGLKYRTDQAEELVKRVDVVPLSLLLAQAALESSWGASRIAREGNNLFGVVTWGDNAIAQPGNGSSGYRYADYGSIQESVRAYILMLNRLPSYAHFRELRSQSRNPYRLAEGLLNYSERRKAYIGDIKGMISGNGLDRYDDCFLASPPPPRPQEKGLLAVVGRWLAPAAAQMTSV